MKGRKTTLVIIGCTLICITITYWYLSYNSSNYKVMSNTYLESKDDVVIDDKPGNVPVKSEEKNTSTADANQTTATSVNTAKDIKDPVPQREIKEQAQAETKPAKEEPPSPAKQEDLLKEIIAKYQNSFLLLKNESLSALNALLAQAKAEYNSLSKDKHALDKMSLGLKYLNLGKALESECDSKFNALASEMEQELKSNNLPLDAVNAARNQYNAEKSARRSLLMSKALK